MSVFSIFWRWVTTASHWHGADGIPERIGQHLLYSVEAMVIAAAIAVPIGVLTGHTGHGGFLAASLANLARALPTVGILTLLAIETSVLSITPVIVALVALAVPQILLNSFEGVRAAPPDAVDAARGMGMRPWQVLGRVEIPVAMPLILLGLRTAAFQVIATATIAAEVGLGGLGRYIIDGFAEQRYSRMVAGAGLVIVLALLTEALFYGLFRLVVSPGVRARLRTA